MAARDIGTGSSVLTIRRSLTILATACWLSACGGGGSSGTAEPAEQGNSDNPTDEPGSAPLDDTEAQPDETDNVDVPGAPVDADPADSGDAPVTELENDPVGSGATTPSTAFFVLEDSSLRLNEASVQVTEAGRVALLTTASLGAGSTLWAGEARSLSARVGPGDAVEGFAANVRVAGVDTVSMGEDGAIAALVSFDGARELQAVLSLDDDGPAVVAREGDEVALPSTTLTLGSFDSVRRTGETVAFVAGVARLQGDLMRHQGSRTTLVAPDRDASRGSAAPRAPLQPDGCRYAYREDDFASRANYAVLDDGAIVYEAVVFAESGADGNPAICPQRNTVISLNENGVTQIAGGVSFGQLSAIVRHGPDGTDSRLVTVGDSVPGMSDTVFVDVKFESALGDGTVLVRALMKQLTARDERVSYWLYDQSGAGRLVALEGERFDSSDAAQTTTLTQFFGPPRLSSDGQVSFSYDSNGANDGGTTWLLAGTPHPGQPHAALEAPGAGALAPIAVTGGPAPAGFAASTFWQTLSAALPLRNGTGYFSGAIADAAADNSVAASGVWRYDADGSISELLVGETTVEIDGLPRSFSIPSVLRANGARDAVFPVGTDGVIALVGTGSSRSRLVYLPLP